MKNKLNVLFRMNFGFFICAIGIVMTINSNLGLSPWDVLHQGLSKIMGITIGQSSILVSMLVIAITYFMGLNIGLGTISNMILIGLLIDFIIFSKLIPVCNSIFSGFLMLLGGIFLNAIGSYLYIGCEFGCGPRDGLMITLVKLSGKKIGFIRFFIELIVLSIGFILGGFVGIGTIISALGLGICVQIVYNFFNFDVNKLKHKNIKECLEFIYK